MRRMPIHVLALTALAALLLAGCGGGKKTTTTAATEASAATSAKTTTTTRTTGSSDLSAIASASNCKELGDLGTQFSSALSGAADSGDLKKTAKLLQEFAAKTPSEIRAEFKVVADDFSKIAEAVGNVKTGTVPDAATLSKLQKLSSEIDSAQLTQASQKISTWLQKNCAP
jgi:hypothetical protein